MAHLGVIQQQLRTDANYRARFLKDPVGALAEHGLILSPEMQMQLRSMVTQAQAHPASLAGAAFGAGGWGSAYKPHGSQFMKPWLSGDAAGKPLAAGNFPLQTTPISPMQTTPIRGIPLIIAFE